MLRRLMVAGLVALARPAATTGAAAAPATRPAGAAIQEANALRAQIHRLHSGAGSWQGYTPPPPGYCRILSTGELVLKELVYLANMAILYGPPGLVSALQRAADGLGDELALCSTRARARCRQPENARLSREGKRASARRRCASQSDATMSARRSMTTGATGAPPALLRS